MLRASLARSRQCSGLPNARGTHSPPVAVSARPSDILPMGTRETPTCCIGHAIVTRGPHADRFAARGRGIFAQKCCDAEARVFSCCGHQVEDHRASCCFSMCCSLGRADSDGLYRARGPRQRACHGTRQRARQRERPNANANACAGLLLLPRPELFRRRRRQFRRASGGEMRARWHLARLLIAPISRPSRS